MSKEQEEIDLNRILVNMDDIKIRITILQQNQTVISKKIDSLSAKLNTLITVLNDAEKTEHIEEVPSNK